jgi:predicted aspartyl protease
MRIPHVVLFVMALALGGCVIHPPDILRPPDATALAADRVDLPTTFVFGCPFVDLKIDGKGPYRFLVDTGAEVMTVTPRVAHEAQIPNSRDYVAKVNGAGGQFEYQRIVTISRIESPGLLLSAVRASILSPEFACLGEVRGVKDFGGVIGMRALQNVLLEIDYPRRQVSLAKPGSVAYPAENGIPYTEFRPHVTITTPSVRYPTTTAVIDTGGDGGFQFADIASYPVLAGLVKRDGYLVGIGGYWRPLQGQLEGDILLGPATWRDPVICGANNNRIGSEALAALRILIDPTKKMLWLLSGETVTATKWNGPLDPHGLSPVLGFGLYPEGDAYVVKEVDPGSRAERAGFKVGDRILVDSPAIKKTGQSPEEHLLQTRMQVLRGSERLEIVVSFEDPPSAISHPTGSAP